MLTTILLQSQSNPYSGIIMIVALIAIFYFFMIRPQNKKQKEIKKFREGLAKNDKVVTAGGIHGKIREINDNYVKLEIAPNVEIRIDKNSVYPSAEEATSESANRQNK